MTASTTTQTAASDTVTLFTDALNVTNAALAKHKDSLPYKPLLQASEKILGDRRIGVEVYDRDPSSPFEYFTIRFREGAFEFVAHGKREPDVAWKVSRSYLEKITESPEDYVENPAKLDWDWLKSRVGLAD